MKAKKPAKKRTSRRAPRKKIGQKRKKNKSDLVIDKACLLAIFIVLATSLMLTATVNLQLRGVIGSDFYYFHAKMAKMYSEGENALFSDYAFSENGGPYPPLFHLFFALLLLIGTPVAVFFIYLFQVLFYPAILATTIFLVYKKMNLRAAAFSGVIMMASIALFDRGVQVIPQSVDMILFPLAIYFLMERRRLAYVLSISAMIYSHGMWAYLHFGALLLYSLVYKKEVKSHIYALIATLPMTALTIIYLPGYLGSHGGSFASKQEELALTSSTYIYGYIGAIVCALALIYIIYLAYKYIKYKKFPYKLSELEKIAFIWLLALVPILFFLIDRFASYAMPPIAIILAGFLIREVRQRKYFIPLLLGLTILAMFFILVSWFAYFKIKNHLFILV